MLPEFLAPLFWEYNFDNLSWEQDADLVVERILVTGQWRAVQWLRRQIGNAEIVRWIVETSGRGLGPSDLRFWQIVAGLPEDLVDEWLADPERRRWWEAVS